MLPLVIQVEPKLVKKSAGEMYLENQRTATKGIDEVEKTAELPEP